MSSKRFLTPFLLPAAEGIERASHGGRQRRSRRLNRRNGVLEEVEGVPWRACGLAAVEAFLQGDADSAAGAGSARRFSRQVAPVEDRPRRGGRPWRGRVPRLARQPWPRLGKPAVALCAVELCELPAEAAEGIHLAGARGVVGIMGRHSILRGHRESFLRKKRLPMSCPGERWGRTSLDAATLPCRGGSCKRIWTATAARVAFARIVLVLVPPPRPRFLVALQPSEVPPPPSLPRWSDDWLLPARRRPLLPPPATGGRREERMCGSPC